VAAESLIRHMKMENAQVDQQKLIKDEQHLICREVKGIVDKMDQRSPPTTRESG
jgi:hypothetical protein